MDRYLVHGQEYKALRDAVGKAVLEGKPQAITTALEVGWAPGFSVQRGSPQHKHLSLFMSKDAVRGAPRVTPCVRNMQAPLASMAMAGQTRTATVKLGAWACSVSLTCEGREHRQAVSDTFMGVASFETLLVPLPLR